ncbi:hypothetical protein ACSFBI_18095 [Variovorax sp. RB3P1]|uniref:hypothetical protein n=1 Tax=Variovorax sp. RB3P1 TaxID=3443732 RepID=UPI003F47621B
MYLSIGRPTPLRELNLPPADISQLKRRIDVAVLDDEPFSQLANLSTHGFKLMELGGDIKSVAQVADFPVVICDIKGVGKAFGSKHEGAHVLYEIRKNYPDKYLIAFTGMEYDATYNEKLIAADKSVTKDANSDQWGQILETALGVVGDPVERWLRLRRSLLARRVELYDVLNLEQAFIKSMQKKDPTILKDAASSDKKNVDAMDIVVKFAMAGLAQLIESAMK